MNRLGKTIIKILVWIIGVVVGLILLVFLLLRIPSVQQFALSKITTFLEKKIETPFRIGRIDLDLPKKLVLEDVYVEDRAGDTLLVAERLRVDMNLWRLINNIVEIQQIDLVGIVGRVTRLAPEGKFNFAYIIDAFIDPNSPPPPQSETPLVINIGEINIERSHIYYEDDVIGLKTDLKIGRLHTEIDKFDLNGAMEFSVPTIEIDDLGGDLSMWTSTWTPVQDNEFLPDSLLNPDEIAEPASSEKLPTISLGHIALKAIDFAYLDEDMGLDSRFQITEFLGQIEDLDLNDQQVTIASLLLNGSNSHLVFKKTNEQETDLEVDTLASTAGDRGWTVEVGKLLISETDFLYRDDNTARTEGFDYGNIRLKQLRGELKDFYFTADSISGSLADLAAKDESGFELKRLSADFSYTNTGAELVNLYAETGNSRLRDHLKIQYPSLDALSDELELLAIEANLDKSHLGMSDVLFFMPDLDTMKATKNIWPHTFHIHGQVKGTLGNLSIPQLEIRGLNQTRLFASAQIKGLPDVDRLNAEIQLGEFKTGKSDLDQLIPKQLLPDSLTFPSEMTLTGRFSGGLQAFNTDLDLLTSEGDVKVEGYFQTQSSANLPDTTYRGNLSIREVDLGKILGMPETLGKTSLAVRVEGSSLNPKQLTANAEAQLISLSAMGYTYEDIEINASADHGVLTLTGNSPDPNIDFDITAGADLRGEYPSIQLELQIDSVNLKNLKLSEENLRYHGLVSADFSTADIDHLNGILEIRNSSVAFNDERYTISPIKLSAEAGDSSNTIQLTSEFLNAHLVGDYELSQLSSAISDIIAVYYQPDSLAKTYVYEPQQFDFSATLMRSRFIQDFLPELTVMENVLLDGSFNSENKFLLAKVTAPRVEYAGTTIEDVNFDVTTLDSTMYYTALVRRIGVSNIELINTLLSGTVVQNQLDFGLWVKDEADKERYHLGMGLFVDAGDFIFRLKEDGLMLNYETWDVNPNNYIQFGNRGIISNNFELSQNGQSLLAQSQDTIPNAPIDLVFSNFRIETFSKILESEFLKMGGGINGKATVSRLDNNPLFVSDLLVDKFYFGKHTIGNLKINVHNEQENRYAANISIDGEGNDLSLVGEFIAVPEVTPELDFDLDIRSISMKTIEAFSLGYLRNGDGFLTGKIAINGTTEAPLIDGDLTFKDASFNVSMLNATLLADDQRIVFDRQGIRFNRFELRDTRNNLARLDGTVATSDYSDFIFNLTMTTDDFQLLNSTAQDNDLFYGLLFVSSNLRITGSLDNPIVNGNLLVGDKTDVTFVLPSEDPGLVERDGIIKFVDRSDTTHVNVFAKLDSLRTTEISGLRLSMNIQTEDEADFTIVIDPGSQDALRIRGKAELTADLDPSGEITLTGTYTVNDGTYSFTFEPVKRVFNFKEGSTITWTGDPMDARLNITAVYKLRAPTLELVQAQVGNNAGLYKQRVPFDVNLGITGQMLKPDLRFSIDLDEDNALISQDVVTKVSTALSQLQENESEMNKQVFALIVLGRFMASNPFESLSGGGVESMARSSVSSLLSSQLNRLAGDLIKGVDLDFDLQSENDYTTGNMQTRTDLNIGVSKLLFDDRLKVTIGSNFELEGQARPGEQTTNIAGDISVDYQLSKDGRYLLRAYRKNQYQVTLQGQFVETGIGFIINMDYEEFKDIFRSNQQKADMFSTDTRQFNQRFDRARMETDSVYRDSVQQIIRDSLMRHDPEFRKRMEERRQREMRQNEQAPQDSSDRKAPQEHISRALPPEWNSNGVRIRERKIREI